MAKTKGIPSIVATGGSGSTGQGAQQHIDATKEVLNTLSEKALRPHIVRIARVVEDRPATNGDLSGGGVLLQNENGRKGVLTAEHCLSDFLGRDWESKEVMLLCTDAPGQPNIAGTPVPLATAVAARNRNGAPSPDIAWIPLHPIDAAALERHGSTFMRPWRKKTPPSRATAGPGTKTCWIITTVHGWFAAHEQELGGEYMFTNLEMLKDWNPQVQVHKDEEGWDYADYVFHDPGSPSYREWAAEMPETLHSEIDLSEASRDGYSGGPLWRMWKTDGETEWDYALTGLAFYQHAANEQGERKLRAHREKSIERITGIEAPPYYKLSP